MCPGCRHAPQSRSLLVVMVAVMVAVMVVVATVVRGVIEGLRCGGGVGDGGAAGQGHIMSFRQNSRILYHLVVEALEEADQPSVTTT